MVGKVDLKKKPLVWRDKEGHRILIKGPTEEDITVENIDAPNIGVLISEKQTMNKIRSYKRS